MSDRFQHLLPAPLELSPALTAGAQYLQVDVARADPPDAAWLVAARVIAHLPTGVERARNIASLCYVSLHGPDSDPPSVLRRIDALLAGERDSDIGLIPQILATLELATAETSATAPAIEDEQSQVDLSWLEKPLDIAGIGIGLAYPKVGVALALASIASGSFSSWLPQRESRLDARYSELAAAVLAKLHSESAQEGRLPGLRSGLAQPEVAVRLVPAAANSPGDGAVGRIGTIVVAGRRGTESERTTLVQAILEQLKAEDSALRGEVEKMLADLQQSRVGTAEAAKAEQRLEQIRSATVEVEGALALACFALEQLGVPPAAVRAISTCATVGIQVGNACAMFAAGALGPFGLAGVVVGAIGTLTSLFGMGGPTTEQVILERLGAIQEYLIEVGKAIERIERRQIEVLNQLNLCSWRFEEGSAQSATPLQE
ncbi:MAG: hypothetical protein J0L92_08120 [Deltaproteobacteria bacterium]|nr:hypothetical protein [Deltaproteobacteria bacterium]